MPNVTADYGVISDLVLSFENFQIGIITCFKGYNFIKLLQVSPYFRF